MSETRLEIKELTIVLVGRFNPAIFHPEWLARKEIIREGEAKAAKLQINHPEVSEFSLDFCTIQVMLDRFSVTTTQEDGFKLTRDLVANVFRCLPESPIFQMGINLNHHYKMNNDSEYADFGHKIVPKEQIWNNILENPKLLKVAIQGERKDDNNGRITATVTNSSKITTNGIEIQINDHYNLFSTSEIDQSDASRAMEILNKGWMDSFNNSEKIINGIFEYATST